jgi:general secretion pathway protein K
MVYRQDGVVIIAVLWICALIMWFALQIGTDARLQGEEQVQRLRKSQALHLAIGGGYEALARMGGQSDSALKGGSFGKTRLGLGSDEESGWLPNGRPHVVTYTTGEALVFIEDENRKVNVNTSRPDQLKAAFTKAGLEEADAAGLADMIADFVDKDDLRRLNGAEKDQYKDKGLPYGPFNGPMTSLDQMLLIPGITPQLFYGYGQSGGEEQENESEVPQIPLLPGKHSLFQMLSVYGTNQMLQDEAAEEALTEQIAKWESGGIYRILSCGKPFIGSQIVIVWLTVRFAPESKTGYEVLYRKIL